MNTLEGNAAAIVLRRAFARGMWRVAAELWLVLIGAERCDLAGEDILYVGGVS